MLEQSPGNFGNSRVPYDWYQTQSHVIITIRIANLKENDVKVTIINDALDVMCQLIDGRQFRMHFNLYKTVIVPDSNWAVDTSKLVINLRKADRKRWHSLEIIPDKNGQKPKSFIGIVSLHDAKNELNNLLSAAEFETKENSTNAITITQSRSANANDQNINEPISLDYNWYQDDNYINIVIHVPNIKMADNRNFLFYEDDINIILTDNSLNWICNLPTGVTNVTFKLCREINSTESRYEISPCRSKIEIKLRKLEDGFWPSFVITDSGENGGGGGGVGAGEGNGNVEATDGVTAVATTVSGVEQLGDVSEQIKNELQQIETMESEHTQIADDDNNQQTTTNSTSIRDNTNITSTTSDQDHHHNQLTVVNNMKDDITVQLNKPTSIDTINSNNNSNNNNNNIIINNNSVCSNNKLQTQVID